jgi:N-acetylglucosaminylphosphatidylinositol deacetylase
LLTAHPDDECMFFAPTVLALRTASVEVFSLCLSVGNADGLGFERRSELEDSLDVLGVPKDKRWVIDHLELQDNFTATWDKALLASIIKPFVVDNNISLQILTFDEYGVSSHPNHRSLPFGVAHLQSNLPSPPRVLTLVTVPLVPKYIGPLAAAYANELAWLHTVTNWFSKAQKDENKSSELASTFVSSPMGYLTAHRAMRAHRSQLVWFRHLYVLFSRYMWVNDWVELHVEIYGT